MVIAPAVVPGRPSQSIGLDVQKLSGIDPALAGGDDASAGSSARTQQLAERGVAGPATALPHLDVIQRLFGRHDIGGIAAHTDDPARDASTAIGAQAYATGNHVAFAGGSPSLHTAAHEAAHVVQQRAGVHLAGGVGATGDRYEQHADQVADLVVQGRSVEGVLDELAPAQPTTSAATTGGPVQRQIDISGFNDRDMMVKRVMAYNAALAKTVAGGASRIGKDHVQKLVGQVLQIKGLLTDRTKLPIEHEVLLKERVDTELQHLTAALAKPADLVLLVPALPRRALAPRVPGQLPRTVGPTSRPAPPRTAKGQPAPTIAPTGKPPKDDVARIVPAKGVPKDVTKGKVPSTPVLRAPEDEASSAPVLGAPKDEVSSTPVLGAPKDEVSSTPILGAPENEVSSAPVLSAPEDEASSAPVWDVEEEGDDDGAPVSEPDVDDRAPARSYESKHFVEDNPDDESGEAGGAPQLRTRREDATRIGFEIEPGAHYSGASTLEKVVDPYLNQTLLTFTTKDGKPLLEMLLDDPKPGPAKKVLFQVEFRTPPLALTDIKPATAMAIRSAITSLKPRDVFGSKAPGAGWARSGACAKLIAALDGAKLDTVSMFRPPPSLAQHVTSSINLGAYPDLPGHQQQALYPQGKGSTSKLALYQKILAALGGSTIDASTRGRNQARTCVKSPIESMVAAERSLGLEGADEIHDAMASAQSPEVASVGRDKRDKHRIAPLAKTVTAITERGEYPSDQGDHATGYLALAEKLQPPLHDPVNNELRVLVEHRGDDLVNAVNDILTGKSSKVWTDFVKAASAMDARAKQSSEVG